MDRTLSEFKMTNLSLLTDNLAISESLPYSSHNELRQYSADYPIIKRFYHWSQSLPGFPFKISNKRW